MTLFEKILSNRGLNYYTCLPLWKLSLTDDEFDELKNLLKDKARIKEFTSVNKEAALYYAEWWRRVFNGGRFGHDDICISLLGDSLLSDKLYEAAKKGALSLGVQRATIRSDNREADYSLRPILYQGGLPMNWINNEISNPNSSWVRFIKALVWNEQDFSEIQSLGVIAQQDQSIKSFCEQLRKAVDNKTPEDLPFCFRNDWWNVLTRTFHEAKIERKHKRPFELSWLFDFDDPHHSIKIRFEITGPNTLPEEFIEEHQLSEAKFISITVKYNNDILYTAEYDERRYCRRNVRYNGTYKVGDEITIEIEETGEVLLIHELDLSDPKLLSLTDNYYNTYSLCDSKKIASSDCRAIAMDGWGGADVSNENYTIDNENYKVFFIKQTIDPITINNTTESKTFDPRRPLCWTIIDQRCVLRTQLLTKEPLYDAKKMLFFKGEEDRIDRNAQKVKFAQKGSRVWNDSPKLGEIRAKIDLGNESVDTVKFINVGELIITKEASNKDTCDIRIKWEGGNITSTEAESLPNDNWRISRDQHPNYAAFLFTPNHGCGVRFLVHIHPAFDDFKILDPSLTELTPGVVIPMVDLHNYRYYLHGIDVNLRLGEDNEEQLQYRPARDYNGIKVKLHRDTDRSEVLWPNIPCEGFLSTFLGGSNTIRNLLERNTLPITEAIDKIRLYKNRSRSPEVYYFKDFPYRIIQGKDNELTVSDCVASITNDEVQSLSLPPYKGKLFAIPVDEPSAAPITISSPFVIPDEILTSTQKQWLVYGNLQGLILPKLIDLDKALDDQERSQMKKSNIERIKDELLNASAFDDKWQSALKWFNLISEGRIPASSMLVMIAIADNPTLLEKLALHLYIKYSDNIEDLALALNEFQRQMQFLWSWVPCDDLTGFIKTGTHYMESLMQDFNRWFMLLRLDNEPIVNPHPLYSDPKLNAFGDGLTSEEARAFFQRTIIQGNPSPNERWVIERRSIHKDIIDGKRDAWNLGDYSPKVLKEIHRSIIYGLKFKFNEQ